jgi:hypothetical protein
MFYKNCEARVEHTCMSILSYNGAIREKIKLFRQLIEQTSNTRFNENQRGSLVDDTCGPNPPAHYAFILRISYLRRTHNNTKRKGACRAYGPIIFVITCLERGHDNHYTFLGLLRKKHTRLCCCLQILVSHTVVWDGTLRFPIRVTRNLWVWEGFPWFRRQWRSILNTLIINQATN